MLETLIHAERIYSPDTAVEFGIEECVMLLMKSRKRHMVEGIKLPNQDKIRTLRELEHLRYSGILEAGTIKQVGIKCKKEKWISHKN